MNHRNVDKTLHWEKRPEHWYTGMVSQYLTTQGALSLKCYVGGINKNRNAADKPASQVAACSKALVWNQMRCALTAHQRQSLKEVLLDNPAKKRRCTWLLYESQALVPVVRHNVAIQLKNCDSCRIFEHRPSTISISKLLLLSAFCDNSKAENGQIESSFTRRKGSKKAFCQKVSFFSGLCWGSYVYCKHNLSNNVEILHNKTLQ